MKIVSGRHDHIPFVRKYLIVTAAITATIGIIMLFWPGQILTWFIPGATGDFFVRFIGSALLGYAGLNVMAAETKDFTAQTITLWSNFITLSVATLLSIAGVIAGEITSFQWLIIGEHVLFVSGFAYCLSVQYKTPRE